MGVFSRPLAATRRALCPARFPPRRAQSQGVYSSGFIPTRKKDRACVWEREKMCVSVCVCICTGADFFFVWCVDYGVATPCRLPTFPGLFFRKSPTKIWALLHTRPDHVGGLLIVPHSHRCHKSNVCWECTESDENFVVVQL